jgi:hypothetical protein
MPRTHLIRLSRSSGSGTVARPAVIVPVACDWLLMAVTLLVRSPGEPYLDA